MSQYLIYFFIAISLSIDAFSVSLLHGAMHIETKRKLFFATIVGLCHLVLPIIGNTIGAILASKFSKTNYIVAIIFIVLAIQTIYNGGDTDKQINARIASLIIIGVAVSIDSFSIGIAFGLVKDKIIMPSIIFAIISFLSVNIGYSCGKKLEITFQKKATYICAIILILLAIKYII